MSSVIGVHDMITYLRLDARSDEARILSANPAEVWFCIDNLSLFRIVSGNMGRLWGRDLVLEIYKDTTESDLVQVRKSTMILQS